MKNAMPVVQAPTVDVGGNALMQIINRAATDPAFDVAKLDQLLAVKERWDAAEARKAFVVALNAFKADPPEILKSRQVDFTSQKGRTHYKHAGLDNASELIGASLAEHGISHRWNVEQTGPKIKVTCILTHALGHSESVTMEASPDESGNKNSIQAVGSTVSYLQRYTLFAASGIAPKNVDDDARGGGDTHEMDAKEKAQFFAQIEALENLKAADVLWAEIATQCTTAGDVPAYDELKAAMAAKRKTFKKAEATTI